MGAAAALGIALLGLSGCDQAKDKDPDATLARKIAETLVADCPAAAPSDEDARAACAAQLSGDKFLAGAMREPFLWGGQTAGAGLHPEDSNMNRFNVYVWRRMYLSLLMFAGTATIEQTADGLTVAHLPMLFRNELETGSYPYPFWHSQKKWNSYQLAREMLIVVEKGQWSGAMRAADQDTSRPQVQHTWSGQWQWQEGNVEMPYVSLYRYLLSPENPHADRLDAAYRALSNGLRQQACFMCHSPDNHANVTQLEFFNYPNQALYARNSIIGDLMANAMPPAANDLGLPGGIADDNERQELITLAQEFKAAGDQALGFEGELKPVVYEAPGASIPARR